MLGQAIWWGGIGLELLLLVRSVRGRLLVRFPVFYAYVLFVWLQELLRFYVYHLHPQSYLPVYWITEGLGVLIGCGAVFEIYRVGLGAYPGTARMARNVLSFIFALALAKAFVDTLNDPRWWLIATNYDLERALRTVQALAVAAVAILFVSYSIPFGRNLRGILLGYGLFVATSVIQLTFVVDSGSGFQQFWSYLHPASYFVVLWVWVTHLWSYAPSPEPRKAVQLEQQYQMLAAATNQRLREMRGYLAKTVRP